MRRGLTSAFMLLLLVGVCWQSVARHWSLPALHASTFLPESFWTRGDIHNNLARMAHMRTVHVARSGEEVYPYSVIPGGVRDVADLREKAARDYVVRRHFAGFNYSRARLERAARAREVYLSYRMGERVYWTRKKVRLIESELLLTDGVITARARCGNQISETPKTEVSDEEPAAVVLDQPVTEIASLGPVIPFRFPGVHPSLPGINANPPSGPRLYAGGFNFPYVNFSAPAPHLCKPGEDEHDKKCRHHRRHPAAPEPATWLLLASGLAAIGWQYRRTRCKVTA